MLMLHLFIFKQDTVQIQFSTFWTAYIILKIYLSFFN
jgi:hypothetical protein